MYTYTTSFLTPFEQFSLLLFIFATNILVYYHFIFM